MNRFFEGLPSFTPFIKEMKRYNLVHFRRDLFAAMSVALLAFPQAIAYSLLANLPIYSGIFAAIFGVMIASLFCGSRQLISGPSTGIVILLQASIAEVLYAYYPNLPSEESMGVVIMLLFQLTALIGIFQIFFSYMHISKVLQFISKPVIFGYFAGVSLAIITLQLFSFLGIEVKEEGLTVFQKWKSLFFHMSQMDIFQLMVGVFSLFILFVFKNSRLPSALIMLCLAGLLAQGMHSFTNVSIHTLEKHLSFDYPELIVPTFSVASLNKLVLPALAISLLSILEVFSVSRMTQAKNNDFVNPNQEIFGVGLANVFLSFFKGVMPVSASISRSILNQSSGAKTRFSGVLSSVFVLFFFYFGFSFLTFIPKASIAALLIFSSLFFFDKKQLTICLRATKEDTVVFAITFLSCMFFTLDNAFFLGIAVSIASYLRKASEPKYMEYAFNEAGRLSILPLTERLHRKVRILGIGGELFFAVGDSLEDTVRKIAKDSHTQVVILRMNGVHNMDASMCLTLLRIHDYLVKKEKKFIISGLVPAVWQVFSHSSLLQQMGRENFFLADEGRPQLSTWKACLRAQELIEQKSFLS